MALTIEPQESTFRQNVESVANYLLQGIRPSPADVVQDSEAQDTVPHSCGTAIGRLVEGRVPQTYKNVVDLFEPRIQAQDVQPGFEVGTAVRWACSDRTLTSLTVFRGMWKTAYKTPALSSPFVLGFIDVMGRNLPRGSLPGVTDNIQDLTYVQPFRLSPKRRRAIQLEIGERRKGQPLPIEPEEMQCGPDELLDLDEIGSHVRLSPKRRRAIQLEIGERRKGQPLPIEPEDL